VYDLTPEIGLPAREIALVWRRRSVGEPARRGETSSPCQRDEGGLEIIAAETDIGHRVIGSRRKRDVSIRPHDRDAVLDRSPDADVAVDISREAIE